MRDQTELTFPAAGPPSVTPSPSGRSLLMSGRGVGFLVALLILVAAAVFVVRDDARYRSAAELTASARLVFSRSAIVVDPDLMLRAAADGMTSVLDPYSTYFSPEEFALFTEGAEGEYVGIGIEIRIRDGLVIVSNVYPQSPASDAFIRPGDRILEIDRQPTHGLHMAGISRRIRGAVDTPVQLRIQSPGGDPREVDLIRAEVHLEEFPLVGVSRSGIGYVRWSGFSAGSADRFAAIIEELSVEQPAGLILDLRANPGGLLDEAVDAAGIFLPQDTPVCRIINRRRESSITITTPPAVDSYTGLLVVVIDEMSASSAEVLAAALHDAGRAVLVGRRSFGKGWVQSIFPIDGGGALRLSTARYATPSGQLLGDPTEARHQFDSLLAGYPHKGIGLHPDTVVAVPPVGPWEAAVRRDGLFVEFVSDHMDDWPATDADDSPYLFEEFRLWLAGHHVTPVVAGSLLQEHLRGIAAPSSADAAVKSGQRMLAQAIKRDTEYLMDREQIPLLRRLWYERLVRLTDPDPGELEALIDLDPDLAAARDIIEQPERFQVMLETAAR